MMKVRRSGLQMFLDPGRMPSNHRDFYCEVAGEMTWQQKPARVIGPGREAALRQLALRPNLMISLPTEAFLFCPKLAAKWFQGADMSRRFNRP